MDLNLKLFVYVSSLITYFSTSQELGVTYENHSEMF